jgi:hypothetical protein
MAAGKVLRAAALAALAAGAFLSLAAADLALRARSALKEAERYGSLAAAPAPAAPSPSPAGRERDLLEARRDYLASQSPAKMSYIWYKSAAEDFAFPGNPWAARARARLPGALAAWRADLAARGVKAEPWMTE